MILLTLEGLPHGGRQRLLRSLASRCPNWLATNTQAESMCTHLAFAALMRKAQALGRLASTDTPEGAVVFMNTPWFEHVPHHPSTRSLLTDMTHELLGRLGCRVHLHVMIMVRVPHDETFEQIVCCCNPCWNATTLADVRATQDCITRDVKAAGPDTGHPFPVVSHCVDCPPFFEENEVIVRRITDEIVRVVNSCSSRES